MHYENVDCRCSTWMYVVISNRHLGGRASISVWTLKCSDSQCQDSSWSMLLHTTSTTPFSIHTKCPWKVSCLLSLQGIWQDSINSLLQGRLLGKMTTPTRKQYCWRSGSGPPWLMGHFAFFCWMKRHKCKVSCYKGASIGHIYGLKSSSGGMWWSSLKMCPIIKNCPKMAVFLFRVTHKFQMLLGKTGQL